MEGSIQYLAHGVLDVHLENSVHSFEGWYPRLQKQQKLKRGSITLRSCAVTCKCRSVADQDKTVSTRCRLGVANVYSEPSCFQFYDSSISEQSDDARAGFCRAAQSHYLGIVIKSKILSLGLSSVKVSFPVFS